VVAVGSINGIAPIVGINYRSGFEVKK